MVIIKNPKNIAYWYKDEGGNVVISDKVPGVKYVRMVSEKLSGGKYNTKIYHDGKIIILNDDGTCKSGYNYTLGIQKTIYKLLDATFPEKEYAQEYKRIYKKVKNEGMCK